MLQVTHAINYASAGYDTWSWHLTQTWLHLVCVLGLYGLCRRILQQFHPDSPWLERTTVPRSGAAVCRAPDDVGRDQLSLGSVVTAHRAFLLPSIVLYMRPRHHDSRRASRSLRRSSMRLALFTKIEAIGRAGCVFLLRRRADSRRRRAAQRMSGRRPVARHRSHLQPRHAEAAVCLVAITGVYLVCYCTPWPATTKRPGYAADMTPPCILHPDHSLVALCAHWFRAGCG